MVCKTCESLPEYVNIQREASRTCHTCSVPSLCNTRSLFTAKQAMNWSGLLRWILSVGAAKMGSPWSRCAGMNPARKAFMHEDQALMNTEKSRVLQQSTSNSKQCAFNFCSSSSFVSHAIVETEQKQRGIENGRYPFLYVIGEARMMKTLNRQKFVMMEIFPRTC